MAVKPLGLGGLNLFGGDAINIGAALGQCIDLAGVDVEAGDLELLLAVEQGKRKANIAEADDSHAGLALLNLALELIERRICGRVGRH